MAKILLIMDGDENKITMQSGMGQKMNASDAASSRDEGNRRRSESRKMGT
ncbi:MAG: hypothetical protein ACP5NK_07235 [Thermoplasmata archaeon]